MDTLPKDVINMIIDYTKQSLSWTDEIKPGFRGEPRLLSTLTIQAGGYCDTIKYRVGLSQNVDINPIKTFLTAIVTKVDKDLEILGIDYGSSMDLSYRQQHLYFELAGGASNSAYSKRIPDEVIPGIVDWLKHIVDLSAKS